MGTILARDIPGSSLTIAYTNYEQDQATRKYLVSSTSRGDAITTTVNAGASDGSALSYGHPDESRLKVNQITASAVGPDRWLVTVQYVRSKFTGFPQSGGGNVALFNAKVSYEAVQLYLDGERWANGLPTGNIAYPRNFNTDPKMPPLPYIWNRPVFTFEVPFSTSTSPLGTSGLDVAVTNVGYVNSGSITALGVTFGPGTCRYDGMVVASQASNNATSLGAINYSGSYRFTYSHGGFYSQKLFWDETADPKEWNAQNWQSVNAGAVP